MATKTAGDEITVKANGYRIHVRARNGHFPEQSGIFVADEVAKAADPTLAKLMEQEENLGGLRGCPSVREGGSHPEVDALYVRLNNRMMETKTRIAGEALRSLGGKVQRSGDGDLFFSRHAGCRDCPCSPGVTVPGGLFLNGAKVCAKADVWVSAR